MNNWDWILNWILNWIIFRPDSTFEWTKNDLNTPTCLSAYLLSAIGPSHQLHHSTKITFVGHRIRLNGRMPHSSVFYHYTSQNGLAGILATNTIVATQPHPATPGMLGGFNIQDGAVFLTRMDPSNSKRAISYNNYRWKLKSTKLAKLTRSPDAWYNITAPYQ